MPIFPYGEKEIAYLKKQDKRMKTLIEMVGPIRRAVDTNLFESLIASVVSQQVSTKAAKTVNKRLSDCFDGPSPASLACATIESIQAVGMSFRKAQYIQSIGKQVHEKTFNLEELCLLPDEEVVKRLIRLPGIGQWTAEMLLIFALLRPNVFSVGDLGIQRGIMRLHHHKEINKKRMERYRKRYAPYGSLAALYLWELASRADFDI